MPRALCCARPLRCEPTRRALHSSAVAGVATALLVFGCASPPAPSPAETAAVRAADRAYARGRLGDAREFLAQGRLDAALRATRRGLAVDDDSPALHRLHAHLLAELGRDDESGRSRERAAALDPPPTPLPRSAHPLDAADLLVVLLAPPELPAADRDRVPRAWPKGPIAAAMRERLGTRLPSARIVELPAARPADAADATRVLRPFGARPVVTLRVDRSFFGSTRKDGSFGVAWLRAAARAHDDEAPHVYSARSVVDALVASGDVRVEAVARALEAVLDSDALAPLRRSVDSPTTRSSATDPATHSATDSTIRSAANARAGSSPGPGAPGVGLAVLFPEIAAHRDRARDAARRYLRTGDLDEAASYFARAVEIDPSDLDARAELAEVRATIEMARALEARASARRAADPGRSAARSGPEAAGVGAAPAAGAVLFEPQLSAPQREALEAQLRDQRARRRGLLAALDALDTTAVAPADETLAALPSAVSDADPTIARGLLLARHAVPPEVRSLHTPDGMLLARFYFAPRSDASRESLWMREDDADGDGRPDRWTAYVAGARTDSWQDRSGTGRPDLHLRFGTDADWPERVEIDEDEDGRPERRLDYTEGRLSAEARDEDADGRFDVFERFTSEGQLAERSEDRDADGEIDVRTGFRDGRVVRREWLTAPPQPD